MNYVKLRVHRPVVGCHPTDFRLAVNALIVESNGLVLGSRRCGDDPGRAFTLHVYS